MALDRASLVVLYCDQGMANVVELYKTTSDVPDALVLCDFGVDKFSTYRDHATKKAVKYVVDQLDAMKAAKKPNDIACTIISHQDGDHWSMLPALVEAIGKAKLKLELGPVYCGGLEWSKAANKAVADYAAVKDKKPAKLLEFEDDETAFANPKKPEKPLYQFDDFKLYLLLSNLSDLGTNPTDDIVKNATSAVILGMLGKSGFVLPGDATARTMNSVNKLVEAVLKAKVFEWPGIEALGVPHHGSVRTFTSDKKYSNFKFGELFAKLMNARSVNASAGFENQHKHPSNKVIDTFKKYTKIEWKSHRYVSYDRDAAQWTRSKATKDGIFTTNDALKTPPTTHNWSFDFKTTVVEGVETVVMTPRRFGEEVLAADRPDDIPIAPAPDAPR